MERKFIITSIFITLGAIAFLSGYLLMPDLNQQPTTDPAGSLSADRHSEKGRTSSGAGNLQHLNNQAGSLISRFSNEVEIGSSEDNVPNTLPLSGRRFITFVQPLTDSKKITAAANNGDIVEIDTVSLTEKVVYVGLTGIVEAMLSPAGNAAIFSFYGTANDKKWVYHNVKTGESSEIGDNLKSAAFSPRGDQAAYLVNNDNGGELLISKEGNVIKRVLKTRLGAVTISWPSQNLISIVSYDKDGYGDLFTLKDSEVLNKVLSYQYDLNVRWSPAGEKIIFSAKDDTGSDVDPASHGSLSETQLFYKDIMNNGATIALDIATNALKCIWADEESAICGITDKTQVKDEFYKIKITDGSKTLVATPDINLLVKELSLSRSGDALFVLNDIDSKLYVLKIK